MGNCKRCGVEPILCVLCALCGEKIPHRKDAKSAKFTLCEIYHRKNLYTIKRY